MSHSLDKTLNERMAHPVGSRGEFILYRRINCCIVITVSVSVVQRRLGYAQVKNIHVPFTYTLKFYQIIDLFYFIFITPVSTLFVPRIIGRNSL